MNMLLLALQASADHLAQPVLGDAVLESGWYDTRVMALAAGEWAPPHAYGQRQHFARLSMADERRRNAFLRRAARPDRRWCRAVAAVLMFGGWSDSRWLGVESSVRPPVKPEDVYRVMRQLWPMENVTAMLYEQSPFIGMLRRAA